MSKKVLSDHQRVGKTFVPPFKAKINPQEIHYVDDVLPEIAWLGFLLFDVESKHLIKVINECVCPFGAEVGIGFPLQSSLANLPPDKWAQLKQRLNQTVLSAEPLRRLHSFVRCYPDGNPFVQIIDEGALGQHTTQDLHFAKKVIGELFDRRSQFASIVQAAVLHCDIRNGRYHVGTTMDEPKFEHVFLAETTEEYRRLGAHARMHVNGNFMLSSRHTAKWAKYFWNRGRVLCPVRIEVVEPELPDDPDILPLFRIIIDFEKLCLRLVAEIWEKLEKDIYDNAPSEVLAALLSRQCNLAVQVARNPSLWNFDSGPLFLRAMTDVYITTAWIMGDLNTRAKQFISHGLGQEKLSIEHLKNELDQASDPEDKAFLEQMIEARNLWLNSQHYAFLQSVDIGSWSGISTREMAVQAGCLDLYNFAYTPWSHSAHSTWNHVGKFDVRPSSNPLLKHLRQPFRLDVDGELNVLMNAAKYFEKSVREIQTRLGISLQADLPYAWLLQRLAKDKELLDEHHGSQSKGD